MGKKNGIAAQVLLKDSMYFIELLLCARYVLDAGEIQRIIKNCLSGVEDAGQEAAHTQTHITSIQQDMPCISKSAWGPIPEDLLCARQ